jgi:SAM-dependent methyltransferase
VHEWWRDPRCHFGTLDESSPVLTDRSDLQAAIGFILLQLDLEKGARILDLCCGPGRYVIELAHRGLDVVGIDINEDYVGLARRLAEQEGVTAEVLVSDMREIPYVNCFDAVINVGTSFGLFETESEDQRAIESVSGALKPGGRFLLEMGNRDYLLKNFEATNSSENPDGSATHVQRSFDYVRSRINTTFRRSASHGILETWSHSWRAYTLTEVAGLLAEARLDLVSTFGSWRSEAYGVDTRRMIVISERRAGP